MSFFDDSRKIHSIHRSYCSLYSQYYFQRIQQLKLSINISTKLSINISTLIIPAFYATRLRHKWPAPSRNK